MSAEKVSLVELPKNKIDFTLVEKNSTRVENLTLQTIEEILRLIRYYSGTQLFTAPYDVLYHTVQNFVRITHIPRGRLSQLVRVVTGQELKFKDDKECSLFYAIYVSKELSIKPLGNEEMREASVDYMGKRK